MNWEYKVLQSKIYVRPDQCTLERKPLLGSFQNELNKLGKDGWHLVSVQNIRLEDGVLFIVAFLERQKQ